MRWLGQAKTLILFDRRQYAAGESVLALESGWIQLPVFQQLILSHWANHPESQLLSFLICKREQGHMYVIKLL